MKKGGCEFITEKYAGCRSGVLETVQNILRLVFMHAIKRRREIIWELLKGLCELSDNESGNGRKCCVDC